MRFFIASITIPPFSRIPLAIPFMRATIRLIPALTIEGIIFENPFNSSTIIVTASTTTVSIFSERPLSNAIIIVIPACTINPMLLLIPCKSVTIICQATSLILDTRVAAESSTTITILTKLSISKEIPEVKAVMKVVIPTELRAKAPTPAATKAIPAPSASIPVPSAAITTAKAAIAGRTGTNITDAAPKIASEPARPIRPLRILLHSMLPSILRTGAITAKAAEATSKAAAPGRARTIAFKAIARTVSIPVIATRLLRTVVQEAPENTFTAFASMTRAVATAISPTPTIGMVAGISLTIAAITPSKAAILTKDLTIFPNGICPIESIALANISIEAAIIVIPTAVLTAFVIPVAFFVNTASIVITPASPSIPFIIDENSISESFLTATAITFKATDIISIAAPCSNIVGV